MFQVFDTRCFHKFDERTVYRERVQYTTTFESLRERELPTDPPIYRDAEAALPVLQLTEGM